MRKQIKAQGAAGKDVDEIYHADQEAEDYNALSTEEDSDAAKEEELVGSVASAPGGKPTQVEEQAPSALSTSATASARSKKEKAVANSSSSIAAVRRGQDTLTK